MKRILVLGAGRSTTTLIHYLLEQAEPLNWMITVADLDEALARKKVGNHPRGAVAVLNSTDEISLYQHVAGADLVISMLPAHMHIPVATACIALGKHMVTASYVSPAMEALHARAQEAGVILMNEIGVDPGIDHLSAMHMIDRVRNAGGEVVLFESFTGGLVAPDSDDNPWNYKFTWNPRNVVMAGSGGAVKFIQEGAYKYIPYHQLFRRTEMIDIEGYGRFEGYANRDSLKYRGVYGLENIRTLYRGTLRRPGFCRAWDCFVKLGMTDDSYELTGLNTMTHRDFTNAFLAYDPINSVELKFMHYLGIPQDSDLMEKMTWLGLFSREPLGLDKGTPAQALEVILSKKWQLNPNDRDMVVMYHKMGYALNGELKMMESSMVCEGDDAEQTAMAKTVGLPVGMCAKLILEGKVTTPGVHVPVTPEFYEPLLVELESRGIRFQEREVPYRGY
jgi:saccharopine dehydrogenase-like NADP-dependent oxidoreductase